jgi:hypothetical protein
LPVALRLGMLPPTAVTHGESSQAAVAGLAVMKPGMHPPVLTASCCAASQSPVATSTGIPPAAAVSSPGSCAWISSNPRE